MNTPVFEPTDPDYASRIRASFALQGVMTYIGAALQRVEPGLVVIELPYRPELSQQNGYFHAGITATIADSAGGYAGYTLLDVDDAVLTVEFKINLLAPADGEKLIATGRVLKPGKTLTICTLEAMVVKDGKSTLCAQGMQTLMRLKARGNSVAA